MGPPSRASEGPGAGSAKGPPAAAAEWLLAVGLRCHVGQCSAQPALSNATDGV